jgi:hypothetical protein
MTKAHEVVAAYWAAAEARDWDAFAALLADDVVYAGGTRVGSSTEWARGHGGLEPPGVTRPVS